MRVVLAYIMICCNYRLCSPDLWRGSGTARAARRYVAIGRDAGIGSVKALSGQPGGLFISPN